MALQIFRDMPRHEYEAIDAVNGSRLALMAESPRHYQLNTVKESDAMRLGTAIHMAYLEPGRFKDSYVCEPDTVHCAPRDDKNKVIKGAEPCWQPAQKQLKDHREWLAQWAAAQARAGKIVLTVDEMEAITGMLNRITEEMRFPPKDPGIITLQEILASKDAELVGVSEYRGHRIKGRIDLLCQTRLGKTIVDIKKAASAREDLFKSKIFNLHYDAKAWLYMKIFEADAFIWFAIEEKAPHAMGLYSAEHFLGIGEKKINKWLDTLTECQRTNEWPWFTNGVVAPVPSDWQLRAFEEM